MIFEGANYAGWDVAPDGQRFLMVQFAGADEKRHDLILVEDFFRELKEKVGGEVTPAGRSRPPAPTGADGFRNQSRDRGLDVPHTEQIPEGGREMSEPRVTLAWRSLQ